MKAVVTGMIATYPLGGVAWDYGQYVLGLQRLGFDVVYLEDSGADSYDPQTGYYSANANYGVEFLARALDELSPSEPIAWHYRAPDGRGFGLSEDEARDAVAEADVLLNVSGSLLLRPEWMTASRIALIDTDPGWNHFVNYPKWDAGDGYPGVTSYRAHDVFFTYAEAIGRDSCMLPILGIDWIPTRPLAIAEAWRAEDPATSWTTVMTWNNFRRPIPGNGVEYGTKERELLAVKSLPQHVSAKLELAVDGNDVPRTELMELGWSIVSSGPLSRSANSYRDYVQRSRGEFSVAKNVYVATGSAWFSCRSVCYLASGRPVVLQDTGFSSIIPTGEGLLAWKDLDGARSALEGVERDYDHHRDAAREVALDYFGSDRVLGDLLQRMGLG